MLQTVNPDFLQSKEEEWETISISAILQPRFFQLKVSLSSFSLSSFKSQVLAGARDRDIHRPGALPATPEVDLRLRVRCPHARLHVCQAPRDNLLPRAHTGTPPPPPRLSVQPNTHVPCTLQYTWHLHSQLGSRIVSPYSHRQVLEGGEWWWGWGGWVEQGGVGGGGIRAIST